MAGRGRCHDLRLVVHELQAWMPCTTSFGSGSGMQVESPPYSNARNSGASSSQLPSRLVVGRGVDATAEKSGARNGLASWRAMTVGGTT